MINRINKINLNTIAFDLNHRDIGRKRTSFKDDFICDLEEKSKV
jgi:hypothetical protein